MKPDLLGYLLRALPPTEELEVEEHLEETPAARMELRRLRHHLAPLDAWETPQPPADLSYRTLRSVASLHITEKSTAKHQPLPGAASPVIQPWTHSQSAALPGGWRRPDVWVSIAILCLLCLAVPPALNYVRQRAGQIECGDNLRNISAAVRRYADDHGGYVPRLSSHGPLAHAGVYAPYLFDAGLWADPMSLNCSRNNPVRPVALSEVQSHDLNDYPFWAKLGGSYGYHLGYLEDSGGKVQLKAIHRRDGEGIPILADRPPRPGEVPNHLVANSPNHGGRGQNVLYLGGHVIFQPDRRASVLDDSDIYRNQLGQQGAGRHKFDAVIGPSEARPIPINVD